MLLLLRFFTFFTFFFKIQKKNFCRFLPCFIRFLELCFLTVEQRLAAAVSCLGRPITKGINRWTGFRYSYARWLQATTGNASWWRLVNTGKCQVNHLGPLIRLKTATGHTQHCHFIKMAMLSDFIITHPENSHSFCRPTEVRRLNWYAV